MRKFLIIQLLLFPLLASAVSLHLVGERAWLDADNAPLPQVLGLFEERGVQVLIDPALQFEKVSGEWDNTQVERLIAQLASPFNYLLEWKQVNSPLGDIYQISAIRIFSDGNASSAKPLVSGRKVLDVVEGAGGLKYIRGEIMVGFSEGSTLDDLNALLGKLNGSVIDVITPPGVYRIKLNDELSVEEALKIASAQAGVEAEPNMAMSRVENKPVNLAGTNEGVNLHLKPGETAVAVFDSGLDSQYADLSFIRGSYNALNPSEEMSDPTGHGTLTAMIASGAVTPQGADPADTGVPVLAIRTFDENGYTSSDTILRAIDYAVNSGVPIISMSWGSEESSGFIESAMNYAVEKGVVLYASAGNEPTGEPIYPAGYSTVIAVGGLNPDGTQWANSNYGDFVPIYEPAVANFSGQTYQGTSISSPYAAFKAARSAEK